MKPRASILAVVVLVASSSGSSFADQRWCGDCLYPCCPQQSMGWTLYVDSNIGAPDFWSTDSVTVREIYRCVHGVQFLFDTRQRGQLVRTALVFPNPSRRMLADRLDLECGSAQLESEFQHCEARYEALTKSLADLSGGTLVEGTRLTFQGKTDPPTIIPKSLLALHWRGKELKLRGYLDVYFAPAL